MPRSNRPRRSGRASQRASGRPAPERTPTVTEISYAGQSWGVRQVRPNDSGRAYRCPGCQGQVGADVAHTVVWPLLSMQTVENRRHWHTVCWAARDRRRPGGSYA